MSFVQRLLRREPVQELPCPRCGTPAPADTDECGACGWDLREAFHGAYVGSHLSDDAPATEPRE